jgi:SAM-dependent methyltransferase
MNDQTMEEGIVATYRRVAREYRASDERHVRCGIYEGHCRQLGEITSSFNRMVSVLDVGCGTGRYFHCLRNVKHLVGLDVSPEMLAEAENPVKAGEITARKVELVCASASVVEFPEASFDLIFSLGMFGYGCPVTEELLCRFSKWLVPKGCLYFDVPDLERLGRAIRCRRALKQMIYPMLPGGAQDWWDRRCDWLPLFAYTQAELRGLVESCGLTRVQIFPREQRFPKERRYKLECIASAGDALVSKKFF